jgi:hydroxyacylglutathione hydrolase
LVIEKQEVGPLGVNCYLVGDETSRTGMVIDPGAEAKAILKRVKALGLDIKYIVLTHAHFDHIGALKEVKEATGAEIAIHADDAQSLQLGNSIALDFGFSFPPPPAPDRLLKDEDSLDLGHRRFLVLHTPGHTPGGICLLGEGVVFTGDTLFNSSVGRTDLPGGNSDEIIDSIRTKLMVLPDNTTVYPGHGPESTIGQERRHNPFLSGY